MNAVAVALACLASVAWAAILFPWKAHRHFLRWTRRAPLIALAGYALLNACGGLVGWSFGRWTGWRPDSAVLRGLLWGSFGQGVIRIQFDKLPKPEFTGEAISAIGSLGALIVGLVDDAVETVAERRLEGLADPELAQYVFDLYWHGVADDPSLSDVERKDLLIKIRSAAQELLGGQEVDRMSARSFLRQSGKKWVVRYTFDPPRVVPR